MAFYHLHLSKNNRLHRPSLSPARVFGLCCLLLLGAASLPGQQTSEVVERAKRVSELIKENKLIEARPDLLFLSNEVGAEERPKIEFYIALSYVYEYYKDSSDASLEEAKKRFEAFLEKNPENELAPLARFNLADIYAALGQYEEALKRYVPLYERPPENVDKDGILRKITRIYVALKQWEAGAPYFAAAMNSAEDPTERTTAAAYLLVAQSRMGEVGNARQLLDFFKNPAPVFFTPRFNAALMEIGDKLYESGQLATAGLFYQLVRSYESLEENLEKHIADLTTRIAQIENNQRFRDQRIEMQAALETARLELEALRKSTNYTPLLSWRIARLYLEMNRNWEAFWRFRILVDEYPDHPQSESILFSSFSLAKELEEIDVARELAEVYFENDSFTEFRSTIVDQLSSIYLEQKNWEGLFALTNQYLSISADDRAAEQIVFKHGMARLERTENEKLVSEFTELLDRYGKNRIADELHYFLGLGNLLEQNHEEAIRYFDQLIGNQASPFQSDAFFRKALAMMGQDRIEEAADQVVEFIKNYPASRLRPEAEMTLGEMRSILGQPAVAMRHFENVREHTDNVELLAKATIKIAELLAQQNQLDRAIGRLEKFIPAHESAPETVDVYAKLAAFYDIEGAPLKAHAALQTAVEKFLKDTSVEAVGPLLIDYIEKDTAVREMRERTRTFLTEVRTDTDLRKELIQDRGKQYRFFQENPNIDPRVKNSFIRDNAFRKDALESPAAVNRLAGEIEKDYKALPQRTAEQWLKTELDAAIAAENIPLAVRLEAALAQLETPPSRPGPGRLELVRDEVIWPQIDPSAKLWILREVARQEPREPIFMLEEMAIEYARTDVELQIHQLLAKLYVELERTEDAIGRHQIISQRFSDRGEVAGRSALEVGRLLIAQGETAEARRALEGVLNRPEWRGRLHADALLLLGRAYAVEGQYGEAHGFFERIILGYPSFHDTLAMAFYEDLKVLRAMGETNSVRTVYDAFKATPGLENTEGAALIKQEIQL